MLNSLCLLVKEIYFVYHLDQKNRTILIDFWGITVLCAFAPNCSERCVLH